MTNSNLTRENPEYHLNLYMVFYYLKSDKNRGNLECSYYDEAQEILRICGDTPQFKLKGIEGKVSEICFRAEDEYYTKSSEESGPDREFCLESHDENLTFEQYLQMGKPRRLSAKISVTLSNPDNK